MTAKDSQATVEGFLDELGGCGYFQILIAILVHGSTMVAAYASLFLSFGSYMPGWTCLDSIIVNDFNVSSFLSDGHGERNRSNDNTSSCDLLNQCRNIVFDNDSYTIVTEWNLACGRNWIMSTMISLHMVGFLVGTILAGHINHYWGRKACHYGSLLIHCLLDIIAIFSFNWPMYAAIRFLEGVTTGSVYLCAYVYPIEFITSTWRGPFTALPTSNTGSLLFAVAAMLLRDWRKLHITSAVLTALCFLPLFWTPESLRWLTIKGKSLKARKVGQKIAKINNRKMPSSEVLELISQAELKKKKDKVVYSVLDLYRYGYFTKTATLAFAWISIALVYFAIMYGVKNLSGDFYTNLMIFSFITTVIYPFVPIFTNTIGRRWGTIIFLMLSVFCCVGLICSHYVGDQVDGGLMVMLLCLLLMTFIDGAWIMCMLYSVEVYPTPLRSIGYSHSSCVARFGGMIAPFLISDQQRSSMLLHIVMGVFTTLTAIFIFFLPETKGQHMADSLKLSKTRGNSDVDETGVIM